MTRSTANPDTKFPLGRNAALGVAAAGVIAIIAGVSSYFSHTAQPDAGCKNRDLALTQDLNEKLAVVATSLGWNPADSYTPAEHLESMALTIPSLPEKVTNGVLEEFLAAADRHKATAKAIPNFPLDDGCTLPEAIATAEMQGQIVERVAVTIAQDIKDNPSQYRDNDKDNNKDILPYTLKSLAEDWPAARQVLTTSYSAFLEQEETNPSPK